MKLIDLYKKWMETGKLPESGLCYCVPDKYKKTLELFAPTEDDRNNYDTYSFLYWASEDNDSPHFHYLDFNKFRQTIALLICAMHNEL